MYVPFKMNLPYFSGASLESYYAEGKKLYDAHKTSIKKSIEQYLSTEGVLNASEIEKDWFPTFNADIFLSHSHKDEKQVIALAGFLQKLGLTAFIDSCVWGYANDLLKQIDNKYCICKTKSDGTVESYDYEKRNQSTAHVHMILNSALLKMMDSTECLIFLDTPNSLKVKDIANGVTNSAWIYSELLLSKYIGRKKPIRKRHQSDVSESFEHNALVVEYDTDISHLRLLSFADIELAYRNAAPGGKAVLDQLYYMKKIQ